VFQEIIYRYSLKKLETAIQACRDLLVTGPKILPVDRAEVETMLKLAEKVIRGFTPGTSPTPLSDQ